MDEREMLIDFIKRQRFASLVTVDKDGYPFTRIVGFLPDGFRCELITQRDSLKVRQLRLHPQVALLWQEPTASVSKTVTLQADAELIDDLQVTGDVRVRYAAVYPQVARRMLGAPVASHLVIRLRPVSLRAEGFANGPRSIRITEF